jgi:hypothetical protein
MMPSLRRNDPVIAHIEKFLIRLFCAIIQESLAETVSDRKNWIPRRGLQNKIFPRHKTHLLDEVLSLN